MKLRIAHAVLIFPILTLLIACGPESRLPADQEALWPRYSPAATAFSLWSPEAEAVRLHLYEKGEGGEVLATYSLKKSSNGVWKLEVEGDLHGRYYTYQIQFKGEWLGETPGRYVYTTGVNGKRAMVIDMDRTDPEGWDQDKGPELDCPSEAFVYELHVRDASIHPESGVEAAGKYIGLAEAGTRGPGGETTALDHMAEMGVSHVHLLPTCDFASVDESRLDKPQFNWGYDPENFTVPEGSYSTDPYNGEVRVREFKEMVSAFHQRGIGVVIDVVFNHTGPYLLSNFNLEYPEYYYRYWEDGSPSNASGCGNETASEKPMMRKYMVETLIHWVQEYHVDGFRFDLMAIHDLKTMNLLADTLQALRPGILLYGEGWSAGDSPYDLEKRALKAHMAQLPGMAAFSDEIRDGIKGSVFDEMDRGFVSGKEGMEESVKMGIVGCVQHPQVDNSRVNASSEPWAAEPWQSVSYVSCHDNHTIFDKLSISVPEADQPEIMLMARLAGTIVLSSQGIPFFHAGTEFLRTKQGNHNSYNSPDSINQIDWSRKREYQELITYYQELARLRKAHPAFHMCSADMVRENLEFKVSRSSVIAYEIKGAASGDDWDRIHVIFNAGTEPLTYQLKGTWNIALSGAEIGELGAFREWVRVPARSALIAYQD